MPRHRGAAHPNPSLHCPRFGGTVTNPSFPTTKTKQFFETLLAPINNLYFKPLFLDFDQDGDYDLVLGGIDKTDALDTPQASCLHSNEVPLSVKLTQSRHLRAGPAILPQHRPAQCRCTQLLGARLGGVLLPTDLRPLK